MRCVICNNLAVEPRVPLVRWLIRGNRLVHSSQLRVEGDLCPAHAMAVRSFKKPTDRLKSFAYGSASPEGLARWFTQARRGAERRAPDDRLPSVVRTRPATDDERNGRRGGVEGHFALCWRCHEPLARRIDANCSECGWNVCPRCQSCARSCSGSRQRRTADGVSSMPKERQASVPRPVISRTSRSPKRPAPAPKPKRPAASKRHVIPSTTPTRRTYLGRMRGQGPTTPEHRYRTEGWE